MPEPQRSLPARQRYLLSLLDALGGDASMLDFQKILFLACREDREPPYEFVPYKFGAFSFTSYADRRKLTERGYLEADERAWRLTDDGRRAAAQQRAARDFKPLARTHGTKHGDALVAETYRLHPYFAARSEIAERVLAGDQDALARVEAARPAKGDAGVVTIGYEGRSLESYLNTLLRDGVTVLCDVRRNPISRKYGFSKSTLTNACDGVGIRYLHMPQLGISSDKRQELETQADYDALFAEYRATHLPTQQAALDDIRGLVAAGERVALTCYEHASTQCHRGCVADALQGQFGKEMTPRHL